MSPPFDGKNLAQRRRFANPDYYNRDPQTDYGSQDYFGPLQPVNSGASDEEKLYVLSPALHERLVQEFKGDEFATEVTTESAPQHATASAAGALLFLLLIIIIGCCVVPCVYLLRDTNLGQSVKEAFKQVKKPPKTRSAYPYNVLKGDPFQRPPPPVSESKTYRSESEPKKQKKHRRPKKSIEIPFSSEESVDIYIHGGDEDDCPVADKNSEEFYFNEAEPTKKCGFKPVNKHRKDKNRHQKEGRLQTVQEECLSSSDDEKEVDIYSRYANPSKKQHSNYYTPNNSSPTRTEYEPGRPFDPEELKSQKYDDLIRNWKIKQTPSGRPDLGPPPPLRTSNKNKQ